MKLTLYRGDAEKIKEFNFNKTYKECLVGQGIYLTDSLRVANSYRTKGSGQVGFFYIFRGYAYNRNDAYQKAFKVFCNEIWNENHDWRDRYPTDSKIAKKFEESLKGKYQSLIEDRSIVAEYTQPPYFDLNCTQQKAQLPGTRYMKVSWNKNLDVGYVTRFDFDQKYFDANVFHVDQNSYDESFWSLMYENKVLIGEQADTIEEYISKNRGKNIIHTVSCYRDFNKGKNSYRRSHESLLWKNIRSVLEPYGIIGFEYNGGRRLGGRYSHRAFCIWDEDFVNRHKVERFK